MGLQNSDGSYSEIKRLVAHDVDANNKLKISSIFSTIQETANSQCTHFGCGWHDLMTKFNACYVLTRMHFEMQQYPESGDEIVIHTWPSKNLKAVFTRFFTLDSADGTKHYGDGVSQWVLFNVVKRVMVKPSECEIHFPEVISRPDPLAMPRGGLYNSAVFETGKVRSMRRTPAYSDFDYNRHVNNARYVEWVADILPLDFHAGNRQISMIDIKYKHEISFDEFVKLPEEERALTVQCAENEQNQYCIRALFHDGSECIECLVK